MNYLSGKKTFEGALYTRDVPTDKSYWEFDFTSARMRKEASYYFFVIADLKGGTEPFFITKYEIRTYFNVSKLLPNCKVKNNESCSSNIGLTTHNSCFLAQAQGEYNASSYGSKDMVYVSYKLKYRSWSILFIASLSLFGAPIITFIGLCILKSGVSSDTFCHMGNEDIDESYLKPSDAWGIVLIILAIIGLIAVVFVTSVFIWFWNTPIVKSSGREQMIMLLIGLTLCFFITIFFLLKPSPASCGLQRTWSSRGVGWLQLLVLNYLNFTASYPADE
uniref:G-protein coupled receptors family 3 profile domain-containing protein n=1 Tax=Amphimedon queenslandica TaxID=400682 RepID=A0A1X7V2W3_AMPQE